MRSFHAMGAARGIVERVERALELAAELDHLGAVWELDADGARARARELEASAARGEELGPLAGTRLDSPGVFAMYPPTLDPQNAIIGYRHLIAGDDELWHAYLQGDVNAFAALQQNGTFERFTHVVDPKTGIPDGTSTLRHREHRRVLIRRSKNLLTFLPDLPGIVSGILGASLFLAYVLLGLAVLHAITLGLSGRPLMLTGAYFTVGLFGWPLLLMAVIGLVETMFALRDRLARKRGPPAAPV